MHRSILFCASGVVATLGLCAAARPAASALVHSTQADSPNARAVARTCPPGAIEDDGSCLAQSGEDNGDTPGQIARRAHLTKAGRWDPYDQIPLLPDRPSDYAAYRYPVPPPQRGQQDQISGYDLDKPDELQRRGTFLRAVGHGAIDIMRQRGTAITLVALRAQVGGARDLYAGHLIGHSVVTEHTRKEGDDIATYLLFYGHMNDSAPGIGRFAELGEGTLLGHVGDSDSPGVVHLHLEVRRWRGIKSPSATLQADGPGALLARENSVVCDPRNVLPLRNE